MGYGGISRAWPDAATEIPGLEMVGLVDLREEAARKRADEHGLHEAFVSTDLAAALDEARPDIVFDCTIPEAHVHVTLEALKRGCHVFGEKPMAHTLMDANRTIAVAQEAGRVYAVMQNYRYHMGLRRLQHFLASGAIGPITTANMINWSVM